MKRVFILIFVSCLSGILLAQTPVETGPKPQPTPPVSSASPAPPPAPAISFEKEQKLEKLWKAYEQIYGLGTSSLKGYRTKGASPYLARLDDPKVHEVALAQLGKAFGRMAAEKFTEAELDYLVQLYTSPIAKKFSQLESQFWVPDVTSPVIYSAIAPPPPPARPHTPPAAPKK